MASQPCHRARRVSAMPPRYFSPPLLSAATQCYDPSGAVKSIDAPCYLDASVSICCAENWGPGAIYSAIDPPQFEASCTDRTWNSPKCPTFCRSGEIQDKQPLFNCGGGNYCCRAPSTDLTCCSDKSALFYLGGYENITTIGGAVGPGYQSTISPASSSVAQSSSTASIDSQSTTDATSSSSAGETSSSTATTTTPSSTTMTTTAASSTTSSITTALPITEATSHSSSLTAGASAGIGVGVGFAVILAAVGGYFFYKYSNRPRSAMLPDQVQMLPRGEYHKPELSAAIPDYARHPYQQNSAEMDGDREERILELPDNRIR